VNGGELNGKRLLSPRTVAYMSTVHASDTLQGRVPGEGFGLSVRVVRSAAASGARVSDGSFGWSGAYGTHFWVDPKEDLIAIMMIQTPVREMRPEFENAVMQAISSKRWRDESTEPIDSLWPLCLRLRPFHSLGLDYAAVGRRHQKVHK
jgi:CubicO group peptidase (beta-lactamase class C family)